MAGLAHIGVGLAAKRFAPKVPVGVLVLAAVAIDILWGVFALAGLDNMKLSPWSHGLFMSAIWSAAAGLLAVFISRKKRIGAIIGLLVFSHWVLDFITHPMGFGRPLPPDLPLLFKASPKVGLGLYQTVAGAFITEFGLLILGVAVYMRAKARPRPRRINIGV